MASSTAVVLAVLATAAALLPSPAMSLPVFTGDSPGFHAASCSQLDGIVWSSVEAALRQDVAVAAGMLRLYFHDCFPQGCDASILLNTTSARETAMDPNLTIQPRAMQLIESIRARAHAVCGPVVSCADITLLATRDIIVISGGHWFNVPLDNLDSLAPASKEKVFDLPDPRTASVAALVESWRPRGALRRAHHRAVEVRQLLRPVRARRRHLLEEARRQLQQAPGPGAEPGRDHPRPVRQRVLQGAADQPGRVHLRHGAGEEQDLGGHREAVRREQGRLLRAVREVNGEARQGAQAGGQRRRDPALQLLQDQRPTRRRCRGRRRRGGGGLRRLRLMAR